jgi:N-acetyl-anhydromuramyl-L-alanine amidase AmpD
MRHINEIIVHCAATRPNQDIGADEIREWHLNRGWRDIGYHYVIRLDGSLEVGRDIRLAGAHTKGRNDHRIGICLVGGVGWDSEPTDNYTDKQMETLRHTITALRSVFGNVSVKGHNDYTDKKTCPNFNVRDWYERKTLY